MLSLAEVNALSIDAFVARFGDVAENSPWVAEAAAAMRPYRSRDAMVAAFAQAVRRAPRHMQVTLIRAHPDLAGRAAMAGEMAEDSRREQAGAGLDRLSPEEFERFTALNGLYRRTFGFPFILAVKGATKEQILEAFETRVGNTPEVEFQTALGQIGRIFRFRIEDRVLPG
ncbi:2-oxo-4-hydroxy-4-carboxy-5-ureidoimidazoline decarboxylase [Prosthecomicrobium sp. N25]|uniref:2-oxo-4-hydroxy-4-carboxy-5-ureidoimidazoline decarboxylase n=1 Tax=Prosthecomicrobium sp. N25 TaxID=3129254 RepID=UPI00307723B8